MGKKLGLGIVGLLIVGAIYYFTAGSEQITAQMKKVVNTELTSLEKEGFSVQNREIKQSQEHFELSFDDTAKITEFFTRQGIQVNINDMAMLKGAKLGVDVNYLPDAYAAISLDIYPLTFPSMVLSMAENDNERALFQKLLDKKTFLTHVAINKLGNGFKGNMKDINEVLQGKQSVTLSMKGLTFSGDIKEQRIASVKEDLTTLSFRLDDDTAFTFSGVKSDYTRTGKTAYDYTTNYTIDHMQLRNKKSFELNAKKLNMQSVSVVKDNLASGVMKGSAAHIKTEEQGKKYTFNDFNLEMKADNFDISNFDKLQHINVNDQKEVNAILQQLISKGVHFEIPTFSVANISEADKKLGGFHLSAKVDVDKSLDIDKIDRNPLLILDAVDANLSIQLSQTLFGIIAQQPKAIMAIMLFQPQDKNGEKLYALELKDGKFTVNGMPVN